MKLISKIFLLLGAALLIAAMLQRPKEKILSKADPVPTAEEEENEGHRPDLPDEALKFRLLQLQDENKYIPADGLLKGKAHLEIMKDELVRRAIARGGNDTDSMTVAGLQPGDWIGIGPGNIGGRIRAIAIDPGNGNNIWLGSVSGGIWHSTTAGASWAPVNDFLVDLAISSIVINPTNPSVMYAGTGELFTTAPNGTEGYPISPDGLRGLGVFKSTDGGLTWNQLAKTNPADSTICPTAGLTCQWSYVQRLAISPDGATLLAATVGGIWRSADGGTSWTLGTGFASGQLFDIDFDPTNSQKAIAGSVGSAVYSTDGGQSWALSTFTPSIGGRVELAYAPSSPNIVYASVNQNSGEIYISKDGGQTFALVNDGNKYLGAQGGYDNIIWVNPVDPDSIVVGGIDLWRSTNAASANPINLTQISAWQCAPQTGTSCAGTSAHADHHMIMADPGFNNTTNKRVYFSNDGGIYRTDDVLGVGQTNGWVDLNNSLAITQFYSGTVTAGDALLGGTQDNGNIRDDPDASLSPEWDPLKWTTPLGGYGDGGYVAADVTDSNYSYIEYSNLVLMRSKDGAKTFSPIYCNPAAINAARQCTSSTGITDTFNGASFVAPFVLDPSNSNRILAGGLSLWSSTNVKSATVPTWTAIKPPLSDGFIPPSNVPISAIAISSTNPDLVVVGHKSGQIFLASDGTSGSPTWNRISTASTPSRFVTRLVFDTTKSPNWIYATFGGFSPNNVYVTKDLGSSWTNISGTGATALPAVPVRSLLVNEYIPNFIYVGTEVGIFASEDAGTTWLLPQGGPANVSVDEVFERTHHILAATHGRGFYTNPNALAGPATYTWNAGNAAAAWLNSAQWGGSGHFPGVTNNPNALANGATDDLAVFGAVNSNFGIGNPIYILMQNSSASGVNNYTAANGAITLGAIQATSSLNRTLQLSSGASTPGTMTLNGTTVNGIANTVLANDSAQQFLFGGDANGSIILTLANPTNNVIQVNGSGSMTLSTDIKGPGRQIEKTGSGTLLMNDGGYNIYSGGTVLTGGTLTFYTSTSSIGSTTAPLTINGGTFDMASTEQTIGALNGTGGTIVNNSTTGNSGVLTVGNGNASGSYGGVIADHTSGNQSVTLTKVGTGTQILTGSNTFSGWTHLNAGTLLVYNTSGSGTGTGEVLLPSNTGSTFGGGTIDGSGGISGDLHFNGTPSDAAPCNISPSSATGDTGILRVGTFYGGAILNIDIAGTTAGASYDQVITTGSVTFFGGAVRVRFLNGFQNSIQSTDVFDILTAGTTLGQSISSSGRLNAFGTQGSFAVQVVNNGKTLRLTDFQVGAVTFASWASAHSLSGANAALTADPDGDGLSNLAEYAFGRDPNAADGGALAQTQIVNDGGTDYLGLTYTRPSGANADTDITYTPQRTTGLAVQWSSADVVVESIVPGPGTLETVTVRSTHPMNTLTQEFLRINVTKP